MLLSFLGFINYYKNHKNLIIYYFLISIILELLHLIIPNRSFQFSTYLVISAGVIFSMLIFYIWRKKVSSFEDRKKSFEKNLHMTRKNNLRLVQEEINTLGSGFQKYLDYNSDQEKEYIQAVIKADFKEEGDEDVFKKLKMILK